MAGRGVPPTDPEKRLRRNKPPELTELEAGVQVAAPKLPGRSKFLAATRRWYATWCAAPQAQEFISTDWLRLHMLAPLVDAFYREKSPAVAKQLLAEIRLNEQRLGATPEDRLRLRWRMVEQAAEAERSATGTDGQGPGRRRRSDPRLRAVK